MNDVDYVLEELLELGAHIDERGPGPGGKAFSVCLASQLLRIRDRSGYERVLNANPAQTRFERDRGRQNIVVKARQMGITTWVAGRFF
jgi:hypothetical protein